MERRTTVTALKAMKKRGEKIVMITAYDFPSARLVEEAGVPLILVGDTLGMVVLGYDTTVPVTVDDIIHHTKAVVRGTRKTHVVADMPFMSFQTGPEEALRNAGRMLKEAGAQSVKLEGGVAVAETVRALVAAGIPVMGHIGLTPQSINQVGGYKIQGKTPAAAVKLINDAVALQEAGAYAVVLELVPAGLSKAISERISIPTIGIGAGVDCDGQVQVFHDLLGLFSEFLPKHAKRYANIGDSIVAAVGQYADDVRAGRFPTDKESFIQRENVLEDVGGLA